ncbi:MAG: DNA-binding protein [Anaerolineaceae bacterium]|nr:MAG: DNA-binding protein [Anaerolineaceae bacterium]
MKGNESRVEKLDELVQLSMLYDFYGELLSDHKKRIFEDYIHNDLSLSEISDELKISRQGVHDIVKRCTIELKNYEEGLSLIKKFTAIKQKLATIKGLCNEFPETGDMDKIHYIETLADDILKEL